MKVANGFIDSHVHLAHEDFAPDRAEVIDRARQNDVRGFIVPATDVRSTEACLTLSASEEGVVIAAGIHPHDVARAASGDIARIASLAREKAVVAIGEIGLDYHYDFSPQDLQKRCFAEQLSVASDLSLPVIVHTRESIDDAITIVRDHVARHPRWCDDGHGGRRGVFHCFTGTEVQARALFELGFYVSFPGILTFKRSPVVDLFRAFSMERVLLETDAPYMAPVPMRGKRNEPSFMVHTAEKMSELSGRPLGEIAEITRRNTIHLFGLDDNA